MKLQMIKSSVIDLQLSKSIDIDGSETNFSLNLGVGFPDDENDLNHFAVTFFSEFQIKEGYIVKIHYQSIFETDGLINDDFKKGNFPKVNAPAIAFPFFRAFVATFLVNAGYEPIILPSVNFVELNKRNQEN